MKIDKIAVCDKDFGKKLFESFERTGFAIITGAQDVGITESMIRDAYEGWKEFFALPLEEKLAFKPEEGQEGYFPFRTENAKDSKVKDLKEFYHDFGSKPLPEAMREVGNDLFEELLSLSFDILYSLQYYMPKELAAKVLERHPAGLVDAYRGAPTLLRAIHYPPLDGTEEAGAERAAAHEDINLVTLLPVATSPGLQVKDAEGNWHDVGGEPGDIVVNVGDMLQEITDGRLRSTTHRVVNPPEGANVARYSMPFFVHARPEVRLSDRYTAGEYLQERLREIYGK